MPEVVTVDLLLVALVPEVEVVARLHTLLEDRAPVPRLRVPSLAVAHHNLVLAVARALNWTFCPCSG